MMYIPFQVNRFQESNLLILEYKYLKSFRVSYSDFSGGVKGKLRTAQEWVVFTSSRTARLELTKVLDAGKNWK